MVSYRRPCICIILLFMCGLRTSIAITCSITGNEARVDAKTFITNQNESCRLSESDFEKVKKRGQLSLTMKNGTLLYEDNGENKSVTLILDSITSAADYKKIHFLKCRNTTYETKGKLRFGQRVKDGAFTEVFDYFQYYSITQTCSCFLCHGDSYNDHPRLTFSFNCIFSNKSRETAELQHTTTLATTTTSPPTTTEARPETTTHSAITQSPASSESTSTVAGSTSTETDYASAAQQPDGDSTPTLAVVGGLITLVVIVIGVTAFVCIRRRWNKRQSEGTESCVTNSSYEDLQGNINEHGYSGLNGNGNDVHNYDTADDPKLTSEQDYSYARFNGQSKFQNAMSALKHERPKENQTGGLNKECTQVVPGNTGDLDFMSERAATSGNDDYDLAKSVTSNKASEPFAVNPGTLFGMECQPPHLTNNTNDNYFVLENDANERIEAIQTTTESFSPEKDNYFLVAESENVQSTTAKGDFALAQFQSPSGNTDKVVDPYDHVRVGHVQTNGYDDGVYDELRKQNVRYESDGLDNDYDHCKTTGHH